MLVLLILLAGILLSMLGFLSLPLATAKTPTLQENEDYRLDQQQK